MKFLERKMQTCKRRKYGDDDALCLQRKQTNY